MKGQRSCREWQTNNISIVEIVVVVGVIGC